MDILTLSDGLVKGALLSPQLVAHPVGPGVIVFSMGFVLRGMDCR
jgi:hypothetical protein